MQKIRKSYIENEFPDEYTGSKYTHTLKGADAKAKANVVQGIPELIEIADEGYFRENTSIKHKKNVKNGWYRYDSRFGIPVYNEYGKVKKYNIFHASMLIRHDENGKKYLYDMVDIIKKRATRLSNKAVRQKLHFFSLVF